MTRTSDIRLGSYFPGYLMLLGILCKMRLPLFPIIALGLIACNKAPRFQPTIANSIYDSAAMLTEQEKDIIFRLIKELNDDVGSQMAVITIDTLNGRTIEEYSIYQAERLQIGREKQLDGILFTIARKNRELRIEVGIGLELIIKDEIAARVVRDVVVPKFKVGKFGTGIYMGLDSIGKLIRRNRELVGKFPRR